MCKSENRTTSCTWSSTCVYELNRGNSQTFFFVESAVDLTVVSARALPSAAIVFEMWIGYWRTVRNQSIEEAMPSKVRDRSIPACTTRRTCFSRHNHGIYLSAREEAFWMESRVVAEASLLGFSWAFFRPEKPKLRELVQYE